MALRTAAVETTRPVRQAVAPLCTPVRLNVHCGCGFASDNISDGKDHAATTGHVLHIHGEIRITR